MNDLVATAARFSGRVADYARYRPTYPAAAIDAILGGLGLVHRLTVIDVGAGTGISSRQLAERGARIIAIEPNPEMRAAAAEGGLDVRNGTAEATGLAGGSADIVTAFQAFHWFATPSAAAEFARLLRDGGRVALVWNVRDDADAFTKAYGRAADLGSTAAQRAGQTNDDPDLAGLLRGAGFGRLRTLSFRHEQRLSLEALLGRARSASYVPQAGPEHERIMGELRGLHRRFAQPDGNVALRYGTRVHLAEKA